MSAEVAPTLLQCRSNDCKDWAEFYVHLAEFWQTDRYDDDKVRRSKKDEEWEGAFCKSHLMRVLDLRLADVGFHRPLRIERVARIKS